MPMGGFGGDMKMGTMGKRMDMVQMMMEHQKSVENTSR
jgi:hypothetical protein